MNLYEEYNEALDRATELGYPVSVPLKLVSKGQSWAGVCYYEELSDPYGLRATSIAINEVMFDYLGLDEARDTIRHEVAHAICINYLYDDSHGEDWKHLASQMGAKPTPTLPGNTPGLGEYNRSVSRYEVVCDCDTYFFKRMSKHLKIVRDNKNAICRTCRRRYELIYL